MKPVTVLHVKDSSGIFGSERVILSLAHAIDKTRFNLHLLCLDRGNGRHSPLLTMAQRMGITATPVRIRSPFDVRAIRTIRHTIEREEASIVQSHDYTSDFYALAAAARLPVACVATAHGSTRESLGKRARLFVTEKILYRLFDRVIAVSNDTYRDLLGKGVRADRLAVIPNGLAAPLMEMESSSTTDTTPIDVPRGSRVLTVIGRLFPDKGHKHFLDALSVVRRARPEAFGLIVGEGPSRPQIAQQVSDLSLQDSVALAGLRGDMKRIYEQSEIVVIPSLREGLPYALLEALWFQRPVVATRVGEIPELVIDGVTGYLVPPADSDALAERMLSMLDDRDAASRMALAGHDLVGKNYTAENMARRAEDLYSVLSSSRSRLQ